MILALWVSLSWAAEADWTVAEVPEWVAPQAVPQGSRPGQEAGGGVQLLLDDEQVDVGRGVETHYYREVMRITSVAGIQDHSELSFSFDPSYESMVLHHIIAFLLWVSSAAKHFPRSFKCSPIVKAFLLHLRLQVHHTSIS